MTYSYTLAVAAIKNQGIDVRQAARFHGISYKKRCYCISQNEAIEKREKSQLSPRMRNRKCARSRRHKGAGTRVS